MRKRQSRRQKAGAWGALVFVFLVLVICIAPNIYQRVTVEAVGSEWVHGDLVTPYRIVAPDMDQAEQERRRLMNDHLKVFRFDDRAEENAQRSVKGLLAYLAEADSATSPSEDLKQQVHQRFGLDLEEATLRTLSTEALTSRTYSDLETIVHHLFVVRGLSADKSLLNSALRSERALIVTDSDDIVATSSLRQVLSYPDEVFNYLERAYIPAYQVKGPVQRAYLDLMKQLLQPTIRFDQAETDKRLETATTMVSAFRVFEPGELIIAEDEPISAVQKAAAEELFARHQKDDWIRLGGGAIVVLLTMVFAFMYAMRYNSDLGFNYRSVLMVALPVVIAVSLGRVVFNLGLSYFLGAFAMPAGMVGLLTVMLFDARFAIVLTTLACALYSVSTGFAFPSLFMNLAGGYAAVFSLSNLQERREQVMSGFYIALANALMAVAVGLIRNPEMPDISTGVMAASLNGLACFLLSMGALPIFESLFQVTTDVRLLELTSGSHPLLVELEEKAPGTFQHSMNVAGLAEAAAEVVGAHYLLVRAGAYFHDIGKAQKPLYFTENQTTPEQKLVHSKLSPAMSTLIIKNHVKDGVEMARKHRLPEKVVEFIPAHHGTSLIKYFYVQALKKAEMDGSDEAISEDEYRYPGPTPATVETAILMLADSLEAVTTSRFSGKAPDETEIRRAVHETVTEKYEDKQLNNSPLTFKDLELIKEAFVRVLQNRFHQRVKYPTMPGRPAVTTAVTVPSDKPGLTPPAAALPAGAAPATTKPAEPSAAEETVRA